MDRVIKSLFFTLTAVGVWVLAGGSSLKELNNQASRIDKKLDSLAASIEDLPLSRGAPTSHICSGRLTTESGAPISISSRASQSTIYFTPYQGSTVALYDGTQWKLHALTERSLALSGLTGDKNYDVFIYNNAGTLTLVLSSAWTNNTTRADALATQDSVLVLSGTPTRRYLGTIRASAATTTEDTPTKRFVWNHYNRLNRWLGVQDLTDTWTYTSSTPRAANNSASNRVEYVVGHENVLVIARAHLPMYGSSYMSAATGIGIDGTTDSSLLRGVMAGTAFSGQNWAEYEGYPGLGYHYLNWLEYVAGATVTMQGDNGNALRSGLMAIVEG